MASATHDTEGFVVAARRIRDVELEQDIELVLRSPVADPGGVQGDWRCTVEIVRNGGSRAALYGYGVDSLQALIVGLAVLRKAVKDLGTRRLAWLGRAEVVGLPLIVQDFDEDFLTLVENLISAEHGRQLLQRKRESKRPP